MIEVTNLTRYYGDFPALQDVSFEAKEGQIVGLLGLNGAGKTTTLKILAGLMPPTSGTVVIDGVDIAKSPQALKSAIGFLPENPPLYTDMRVRDFVAHAGRLKGMPAELVERRLDAVLHTAQLDGREDQVIDTLSHGYRKRVGIAATIIHDPRLVILDEPISGLDPVQIVEMRKVIRALAQERAVLVSSHILSEVEQTCDWLIILADGKLVAQGTEDELARPSLRLAVRGETEAVRSFLASHDTVEGEPALEVVGDVVEALVTLKADDRERLAADLIGAGFGLREMKDEGRLEEVFLTTTGGREDAA